MLSGHPSCTPKTKEKVLQAAQELAYYPNHLAKRLRQQRSGTFIAVFSDIRNPVFADMMQGIEDVAYKNGYDMLIGNSGNSLEREEDYLRGFLSRKVDGVLLITPRVDLRQVSALARRLPLVLINEPRAPEDIPCVGIDDFAAVFELTERVIALGYRRLAYISGDNAGIAARRREGFEAAVSRHKLEDGATILSGGSGMGHGVEGMRALSKLPQLPQCVICYNDEVAIGAIKQAQESGLRMPQDIAFCGFDDIYTAGLPWPSLTTVRQPACEIGAHAAGMLVDLQRGNPLPAQKVNLPYELRIRSSTPRLGG